MALVELGLIHRRAGGTLHGDQPIICLESVLALETFARKGQC